MLLFKFRYLSISRLIQRIVSHKMIQDHSKKRRGFHKKISVLLIKIRILLSFYLVAHSGDRTKVTVFYSLLHGLIADTLHRRKFRKPVNHWQIIQKERTRSTRTVLIRITSPRTLRTRLKGRLIRPLARRHREAFDLTAGRRRGLRGARSLNVHPIIRRSSN